jgi:hypothetical protein
VLPAVPEVLVPAVLLEVVSDAPVVVSSRRWQAVSEAAATRVMAPICAILRRSMRNFLVEKTGLTKHARVAPS